MSHGHIASVATIPNVILDDATLHKGEARSRSGFKTGSQVVLGHLAAAFNRLRCGWKPQPRVVKRFLESVDYRVESFRSDEKFFGSGLAGSVDFQALSFCFNWATTSGCESFTSLFS